MRLSKNNFKILIKKIKMDRNTIQKILLIFLLACLLLVLKIFNVVGFNESQSETEVNIMLVVQNEYGRFLEYLEMGG
jgi:hypothetical protein